MSESSEEVYTIPDHIRMHPSMYYGKLGDGTEYGDCIYLMLQEIIDNSIDEFKVGYGKRVEVSVDYATGEMSVRDYGRGVWVEKLEDCFIAHYCGGMFADFEKDPAFSGVGASTISALSESFLAQSVRDVSCTVCPRWKIWEACGSAWEEGIVRHWGMWRRRAEWTARPLDARHNGTPRVYRR